MVTLLHGEAVPSQTSGLFHGTLNPELPPLDRNRSRRTSGTGQGDKFIGFCGMMEGEKVYEPRA